MRITEILESYVLAALAEAEQAGELPPAGAVEVVIERPKEADNGDFSTNAALRLARVMRMSPLDIANKIAETIGQKLELESVSAAAPGFVNFTLSPAWLQSQIPEVLRQPETYGNLMIGAGEKVQVEFVSVNPTGPLHVGHARGGVIGSTIANVIEAAGYDVTREYYVNDGGNQMRVFNETLYARYMQAAGHDVPLPEGAYEGEYLTEYAEGLLESEGDRFVAMDRDEATAGMAAIALQDTLKMIREDVALLGIEYDVWYSEKSMLENGKFEQTIALMEDLGQIVDRDGARWLKGQDGDDQDNVVIRSGGGGPTYFGTDIAYHHDKFKEREFSKVIDVWGADHHGHVDRLKAAMGGLDINPDRLTIILNQIVSFKEGDVAKRFSKRKGVMVTLRELVNEVGADACRYTFLSRSAEAQMEFDIELAASRSMDNPVYYVQYAHARISSMLRSAAEQGVDSSDADLSLLTHAAELALIHQIIDLPEVIALSAERTEATQLPYYAYELARAFSTFYEHCRVLSENEEDLPVSKARLQLIDATRIGLARTLKLMGMSAPEKM
ncbi:MAG: arginine--tRNA ligase [Chloroflexi bacterium]|nr:arginine--tRNA ligase [Chloroflexota bacterium]